MKRLYEASSGVSEEIKESVVKELRLGYMNLDEGMFEQARINFQLAISLDPKCADAYWGLMLLKLKIQNEDDLTENPVTYKNAINLPEYQKAMETASEEKEKIYDALMEGVRAVNAGDNY